MTDSKSDLRERVQAQFRLNLEQQKKRAKELLRAAQAGEAAALQRVAAASSHADGRGEASAIKLADAQFVIAKELRFASWPQLKNHIAAMERERCFIEEKQPSLDGDLKTLHIRCGSDIQPTLVEAGFGGDFLEHSNPYCQGPVTNAPNHLEQRAQFLVDAYGKYQGFSFADALAKGHEEERRLVASVEDYERVVLWMEHDSYDQLVLIRCLAHYANAKAPRVLELISVNRFPGSARFIGLGQLPAEALRLLWQQRRPVNSAQLAVAADAWKALISDSPKHLAAMMRTGTPALPHLAPALHRHLQELPSVENGFGLTEQLILSIVSEGSCTISRTWQVLMTEREPLPWLGDIMFLHIIERMEEAAEKVFERVPVAGENRFKDQLSITELGRAVLHGEKDWLSLRPPVRWVGGVEIRSSVSCWRWNEARRDASRSP